LAYATVRAWLAKHPPALHPDLGELDEPGRGVLCDHHPPGDPAGSFPSVADLLAAIRRFVDGWNERCQPFVWVKDADDIMVKAPRNRTSGTEH
jgi:hypothetical protein